ncbi:MAG TPA: FAD-dependent oxidoreductase, partial [Mycobacteriales bacterium]|nr:FAD-dependent oxidoreductase [Mycobacteriales bacterium]
MTRQRLVVVGNGMVGHRLIDALRSRDRDRSWDITIIGEEPRPAYDRVALSSWFNGATPDDLTLDPACYSGAELMLGERVVGIDRWARTVATSTGRAVGYDALVLATGSSAFVPPIPGADQPGCFVYRTIEDLQAISAAAHVAGVRSGAVVGGGLLGLEAANALQALGLETHVVEFASRLMPMQVDDGGGEALRRRVEQLGVHLHLGAATERIEPGPPLRMVFADGSAVNADLVVFSAGIRPRDGLARDAGLAVGERGGVVVDEGCRTEDERIWAVGEVACLGGRTYGLVAPGYAMAEVVADRLLGGTATFPGADTSTKLKLLGVDVASFGDAMATTPGAL